MDGRRLTVRVGTAAAVVGGLLVVPATAASAALPAGCSQVGSTVTCTYSSTGAEQSFDVPAGVSSLDVSAVGGRGGDGSNPYGSSTLAGRGASVRSTLTVTPASTLYVYVGGNAGTGNCLPGISCTGGYNGGAGSFRGGGGGGASDVRTVADGSDGSFESRLLVAGGGGGGGGAVTGADANCPPLPGGSGGDAGESGASGTSCGDTPGGGGGQAGTSTSGGSGGEPGGQPGGLAGGGSGGNGSGGGAGGGLYGGGGGGGPTVTPGFSQTGAGGGGGGSNLLSGGTATVSTTEDPQIVIRYTTGGTTPVRPQIRINDASVAEGNSGTKSLIVPVFLGRATTVPVSMRYATANGTAVAPSDYTAVSGTLTIPAGSIRGNIFVPIRGDVTREANQAFTVNLSNPVNGTFLDRQGVGTIVNDD